MTDLPTPTPTMLRRMAANVDVDVERAERELDRLRERAATYRDMAEAEPDVRKAWWRNYPRENA